MNTTTVVPSAFARTGPGWRYRLESIPIRRLRGFSLASVLVAATGVMQAVNMMSAPGRRSAEGLLMSRAWMVNTAGSLERVTDWYDHPPLGWAMLSGWTSITAAFDRAPTAVGAGRELMLVAQLVAAGLLWVLARRLGLARWAAGLALVLFGLSPVALQLHRQVSLHNLVTPWIIAAFVLSCSPRRQLVAFAASGACLAAAVLTHEAALLFVPVVAWQAWRTSLPSTRRYALVVGGCLFLLVCAVYALGTALNGELVAGSGHGGMLDGIWFQLVEHPAAAQLLDGSVFDLDPVGLTLMLVAAPLAMASVPRLRPVAATTLLLAALALGPFGFRPSLVVELLPFGALTVAGVVQHAWRRWTLPQPGRRIAAVGVTVAVAVGAVAGWVTDQRRLLTGDPDAALGDAERWIAANVPHERGLIVDDALWVDLVEAGFPPERLAGYGMLDLDPDLGPRRSGTWRDYRAVVVTGSLQDRPGSSVQVDEALRHSVPLAAFGAGTDRVEIRSIVAEGAVSIARANDHDLLEAADAGTALADNPSIAFRPAARDALMAGDVDQRVMATLVALAVDRQLEVLAFPVDPAEADNGAPRRMVELRLATADDVQAVADLLGAQVPPYRPAAVDVGPSLTMTMTYPPAALI